MMKIFTLLLTLFVVSCEGLHGISTNAALNVPRGGGAIGPIDGDMAMKLSKTAATAYVAGSGAKYIASQTGQGGTGIGDYVTCECMQRHALMTAIACGMYGLIDTGFDSLKTLSALALLSLALKLKSSGVSVDTIKDNWEETAIALGLAFIAFVN